MTQLAQTNRGDGWRGRWLVLGLITAALVMAVFAFIYRQDAWKRRPTTLPGDREGQVLERAEEKVQG
jgi:hypothetical protein